MTAAQDQQPEFGIHAEQRGSAVLVWLCGSLHMDAPTALGDRLKEFVTPATRQMVLDMSELAFISSEGLGGIVAAHVHLCRQGARLKLVRPSPDIREMLELTHLSQLLPICRNIQTALAAD